MNPPAERNSRVPVLRRLCPRKLQGGHDRVRLSAGRSEVASIRNGGDVLKRTLILACGVLISGCASAPQPWNRSAPARAESQVAESPVKVDLSDGLDLEEAIALALEKNPGFQASRLGTDLSRAERVIAATYPYNPEFGIEASRATPFGKTGDSVVKLSLSQTFETGGKRGYRIAAAEAGIEQSVASLADDRRLLRARVTAQFYELLFLVQREAIATQSLELAGRLLEVVEARFNAKQIPEIEVNILRLDHGRAMAEKEKAARETLVARANLAASIGQPDRLDFQLKGELGAVIVIPDRDRLQRTAQEKRPDLRAAQARLRALEEKLRLANVLASPDVTVGLFAARETAVIDSPDGVLIDPDKILGVNLSIPIPFVNTRRGERLEAELERRRALLDVETVSQEIRRDVETAVSRIESARTVVESYEKDLNTLAQRNLDDTLRAYQAGEVGTLQTLRAQEDLNRAKTAYLEAQFALRLALAEIEAAMDTRLSDVK